MLIAYDRDTAGNSAAESLATTLNDAGIDAFRILLPKNMGVNAYACQVTPATKSLELAIRQAEWLGNGEAPTISTVAMNADLLTQTNTAVVAKVDASTDTSDGEPIIDAGDIAAQLEDETADELAERTDPVDATNNDSALATVDNATPSPRLSLAATPETETRTTISDSAALPEPTTASPLPATPVPVNETIGEHDIMYTFGERQFRLRGLSKNLSHEQLRV